MAEREQRQRHADDHGEEADHDVVSSGTQDADKLKSELDDLLDEIDEVLEDNAEEFVRNYIQKGGQ